LSSPFGELIFLATSLSPWLFYNSMQISADNEAKE